MGGPDSGASNGPWEHAIERLGEDAALVECGPMRLVIQGAMGGKPRPDLCVEAAKKAIGFLEEVAAFWTSLKKPFGEMSPPPGGTLAREMWRAVAAVGDPDLTPMAAVAGTIADATADFLRSHGLDKIVVNNGGDLAIRLGKAESLTIGIRPDVAKPAIAHSIRISSDMGVGGVCTSGLGGRSMSRGVASAATTLASTAAIADAAATAVANATFVDRPSVVRVPADVLDPETDLKGVQVTAFVGDLTEAEIAEALDRGLARAKALVEAGAIHGAIVTVKGRTLSFGEPALSLKRL